MQVHIGTSGWHYKHWLGEFYPERFPPAKMFTWYARHFHTVEINNSFYRLPDQKTFAHWKELAPAGFIFAVKASRFITHIKRLNDAEASVELLFERARPLADSLGPVLFQMPPKWKLDLTRLADFLNILPPSHRCVLEFRDESWYVPPVYELMKQHNVALCLHDWREFAWPMELTADFTYIRFHGSGARYGGCYPDAELRQWAKRVQSWKSHLQQAFVYFNNDIGCHAIRNATTLQKMLAAFISFPKSHAA